MSAKRNIADVLNAIAAHVPELKPEIDQLVFGAWFTAPEMAAKDWHRATHFLAANVPATHPKHEIVKAIFNGERAS